MSYLTDAELAEPAARKRVVAVIAIALISIIGLILFGTEISRRVINTADAWEEFSVNHSKRLESLSELRGAIGYGGIIHNFKNYVLRYDLTYKAKLEENFTDFDRERAILETLLMHEEDRNLLKVITSTFDEYRSLIQKVIAFPRDSDPRLIDQVVKVDDGPALAAFSSLSDHLKDQRLQHEAITNQQINGTLNLLYYGVAIIVLIIIGSGVTIFMILRAYKAQREADIANRAKSDFLASMSHELRTPLNAVLGFAQLLEIDRENPISENQKQYVHSILRGGGHLLELIEQVLDLAKIESGNFILSIENTDPGPVLDECLEMINKIAESKGIQINRTHGSEEGETPIIRADMTRLRQIFLNLLSNAVKYNVENGSISIACEEVAGDVCRFTVSDTGIGIKPELREKVFRPFNRLGFEASNIEGAGVGLAITRHLVELMGGKIDFTSQQGEGTSFWFELPLSPVSRAQWEKGKLPDRVTSRGAWDMPKDQLRVLYVEDNPSNVYLMQMILGQDERFILKDVHTAELGLEVARQDNPDIILMDINLPGISGIEALRELRRNADTEDIPVIAVSANAMPRDIKLAMDAGFDAYLTKPIDIEKALSTILDVVHKTNSGHVKENDGPES